MNSGTQDLVARRLHIHGRVQGVGYRESMRREAARLNVTGWVRNRRDGTVEALVCGTSENVGRMVEWAKRGPGLALVSRVVVNVAEPTDSGVFEILFTE